MKKITDKKGQPLWTWVMAVLPVCITFIVYLPALQNGFVNWDDNLYVYENQNIRALNLDSFRWVLTAVVAGHWHPLTMISYAFDYAVWGLDPFGYHLTNVILHALNTFLVFVLTVRLIEYRGISSFIPNPSSLIPAFVTALLFGIHPLHVESVAWISERKDVLCAFFYLLGLISYISYISAKSLRSYVLSLLFFVLALMSKPMAVSLPVVLLIVDWFPLKRLNVKTASIEKIPFFALSLLFSLIAVSAQGSAVMTLEEYPLASRVAVALRSFIFYLFDTIFPYNLAPFYPYPTGSKILSLEYIGYSILFIVIAIFCVRNMKRNKPVAAALFYYVITLAPVIGIVKVGDIAAADRYMYLPSLGPFLLIGIGTAHYFAPTFRKAAWIIIPGIILCLFVVMTVSQITIWRDSISLWSHEISIFPDVSLPYYNRGVAYSDLRKYEKALSDLGKAVEINPDYMEAYNNLCYIHNELGNYSLALQECGRAIEFDPKFAKAFDNRGNAFRGLGNYMEALDNYNRAIGLDPENAKAYNNRGAVYSALGKYQQALNDFSMAIRLMPSYAEAYNNRGTVYFEMKDRMAALNDLKAAVVNNPRYGSAYFNLGLLYLDLGNKEEAVMNMKIAAGLGIRQAQEYLAGVR